MDELRDHPAIDDAKALITRLRPAARAMLRPWPLEKFDVRGDAQASLNLKPADDEAVHRLRR